jgi:hypothetical protein
VSIHRPDHTNIIIFIIRQLGAPTAENIASLNKQLASKHDLHLAVREHEATLEGSLEGLRRLFLDMYEAGVEAQNIAARMPDLMRATAQEGIRAGQACDHNSPREAISGIGAGICGDCGAVVGERRRSGT